MLQQRTEVRARLVCERQGQGRAPPPYSCLSIMAPVEARAGDPELPGRLLRKQGALRRGCGPATESWDTARRHSQATGVLVVKLFALIWW